MNKKNNKTTYAAEAATQTETNGIYTQELFAATPLDVIIDTSVLSDADYYMFRSALIDYVDDKSSEEIQKYIADIKASMIVDFNENCSCNSIESFDGSLSYAVKYNVLQMLYKSLWNALVSENANYTEMSDDVKVGIMSCIGSELKL